MLASPTHSPAAHSPAAQRRAARRNGGGSAHGLFSSLVEHEYEFDPVPLGESSLNRNNSPHSAAGAGVSSPKNPRKRSSSHLGFVPQQLENTTSTSTTTSTTTAAAAEVSKEPAKTKGSRPHKVARKGSSRKELRRASKKQQPDNSGSSRASAPTVPPSPRFAWGANTAPQVPASPPPARKHRVTTTGSDTPSRLPPRSAKEATDSAHRRRAIAKRFRIAEDDDEGVDQVEAGFGSTPSKNATATATPDDKSKRNRASRTGSLRYIMSPMMRTLARVSSDESMENAENAAGAKAERKAKRKAEKLSKKNAASERRNLSKSASVRGGGSASSRGGSGMGGTTSKRSRFGTITDKIGSIASHKRTRKDVRNAFSVMPDDAEPVNRGLVFGNDLDVVMRRERQRWGSNLDVPMCIKRAVLRVQSAGMDQEGIFRLSVNHQELNSVKAEVDKGRQVDFEERDPHFAACFIKLFLRELQAESIIPAAAQVEIFATVDDSDRVDVAALKRVLEGIPDDNWRLLRELTHLWNATAQHSEKNKMNPRNLAITTGPNIFKSDCGSEPMTASGAIEEAARSTKVAVIVETMITSCEELFGPASTTFAAPAWATMEEISAAARPFDDLFSAAASGNMTVASGSDEQSDGSVDEDFEEIVLDLEGAADQLDSILDTLC